MAGGEGSRLRPLTANRPKPLVPILNRPIMGHVVDLLAKHGFTDVTATLHYLSDHIQEAFGEGEDYDVTMHYCVEDTPLGTAGSVRQAYDHLRDGTFVIASGDALTDCDLTAALAFHHQKGAKVTIVLKRVPNPLEFGIVITNADGRIERFLEKPGWSEVFSDTVNTGIYIVEGEVLDLMEADRPYDWSQDIFPQLLAAGEPLYGFEMEGYWCDVGTISQYMEAQRDALEGRVQLLKMPEPQSPGIWVGEGTLVDSQAMLIGPVFIGRDCRIKRGAVIEACSVIGDGTIIEEEATISGSVIGDGGYVGPSAKITGAVIGSRVTIKRDSGIGDEAVIGDRCLIDVGAQIRPRIKLWPDKMVERGATVTMSLIHGNKWRGSLFRELGVAGLSNIESTPDFATRLGLAFGTTLPEHSRVVIARDSSRSSRMLKRSLVGALLGAGCDVVDLHGQPVPVLRHHVRSTGARAAINIRKLPNSDRTSLIEMFDADAGYIPRAHERKVESAFFREEFRRIDPNELGEIEINSSSRELYRKRFVELVPRRTRGRRPRVVVDYGFTSVSPILPGLLHEVGVEVISLNLHNDAHAAPRTHEQRQAHLQQLGLIVGSLDSDLGLLVANEGERLFLVDEFGLPVTGNTLFAALCDLVLRTRPGVRIAMSVTAPQRLVELLVGRGAEVVRTRATGRDLVDSAARGDFGFVGDENGGFIWPEFHPGFDAMFGAAQVIAMLANEGLRLGELVRTLPEFHLIYEQVPCPWEAKGTVMRRFAEAHQGRDQVELTDGIKVYDSHGWVLLLPDTFLPVMHLYAESPSVEEARAQLEGVKSQVAGWVD